MSRRLFSKVRHSLARGEAVLPRAPGTRLVPRGDDEVENADCEIDDANFGEFEDGQLDGLPIRILDARPLNQTLDDDISQCTQQGHLPANAAAWLVGKHNLPIGKPARLDQLFMMGAATAIVGVL